MTIDKQTDNMEDTPLILHIPHASQNIPEQYARAFCLSEIELQQELLRMTDHYTDELFTCDGATRICYLVSRLILDVERFEDDELEHMSKIGMGVIYTHNSDLKPLRNTPSATERELLLQTYYRPHHAKLDEACKQQLAKHGKCLIVDCHSFPTQSLPYELKIHGELPRPQICIGTDTYHTSRELQEACCQALQRRGYEVSLNEPFGGALVPRAYYQKEASVQSLMIELRRDLYMNETTGEKNANFTKLQKDIHGILNEMVQQLKKA